MKKLMIVATLACVASLSYGAAASWSMTGKSIFDGTGGTEAANKYSGSVYFIDGSLMSQSSLYTYLCEGSDITKATGYAATGVASSGTIGTSSAANTIEYGEQGTSGSVNWYFVVIDDDQAYFSNIKSSDYPATSTATGVGFDSQNKDSLGTYSSLAPSGSGFLGSGHWSKMESVPEPFSGALALLGVGLVGLRRKLKKQKKA